MSNNTYAIYESDIKECGVYNVMASFMNGLAKGFKEANLKIYDYEDAKKNNVNIDIALGFNLSGFNHWPEVISANKINVIWSIDSIFAQNAELFRKCNDISNVIVFGVAPADYEAKKQYLPNLKYMYMPHATDKDLWKKQDFEKENDIVFLSSLYDFESKIEPLKPDKVLYSLVNEFVDIIEKKPTLSFWDVYSIANESAQLNLSIDDYTKMFYIVTSIIEERQKIKMIDSLSNMNVKVFGSELWKKYIKGNVQYMGKADLKDSIKIINQSKIALHCQAPQYNYGLHERFLNASCVGTFNLVSDTPSIKDEFQDNFAYFNHADFSDIEQKAIYYLQNEDEREQKALEAMKITHSKHLWKNRAEAIDELFTV